MLKIGDHYMLTYFLGVICYYKRVIVIINYKKGIVLKLKCIIN